MTQHFCGAFAAWALADGTSKVAKARIPAKAKRAVERQYAKGEQYDFSPEIPSLQSIFYLREFRLGPRRNEFVSASIRITRAWAAAWGRLIYLGVIVCQELSLQRKAKKRLPQRCGERRCGATREELKRADNPPSSTSRRLGRPRCAAPTKAEAERPRFRPLLGQSGAPRRAGVDRRNPRNVKANEEATKLFGFGGIFVERFFDHVVELALELGGVGFLLFGDAAPDEGARSGAAKIDDESAFGVRDADDARAPAAPSGGIGFQLRAARGAEAIDDVEVGVIGDVSEALLD